eukprot:366013-Chlamydomonas_euryale.AAC.8
MVRRRARQPGSVRPASACMGCSWRGECLSATRPAEVGRHSDTEHAPSCQGRILFGRSRDRWMQAQLAIWCAAELDAETGPRGRGRSGKAVALSTDCLHSFWPGPDRQAPDCGINPKAEPNLKAQREWRARADLRSQGVTSERRVQEAAAETWAVDVGACEQAWDAAQKRCRFDARCGQGCRCCHSVREAQDEDVPPPRHFPLDDFPVNRGVWKGRLARRPPVS